MSSFGSSGSKWQTALIAAATVVLASGFGFLYLSKKSKHTRSRSPSSGRRRSSSGLFPVAVVEDISNDHDDGEHVHAPHTGHIAPTTSTTSPSTPDAVPVDTATISPSTTATTALTETPPTTMDDITTLPHTAVDAAVDVPVVDAAAVDVPVVDAVTTPAETKEQSQPEQQPVPAQQPEEEQQSLPQSDHAEGATTEQKETSTGTQADLSETTGANDEAEEVSIFERSAVFVESTSSADEDSPIDDVSTQAPPDDIAPDQDANQEISTGDDSHTSVSTDYAPPSGTGEDSGPGGEVSDDDSNHILFTSTASAVVIGGSDVSAFDCKDIDQEGEDRSVARHASRLANEATVSSSPQPASPGPSCADLVVEDHHQQEKQQQGESTPPSVDDDNVAMNAADPIKFVNDLDIDDEETTAQKVDNAIKFVNDLDIDDEKTHTGNEDPLIAQDTPDLEGIGSQEKTNNDVEAVVDDDGDNDDATVEQIVGQVVKDAIEEAIHHTEDEADATVETETAPQPPHDAVDIVIDGDDGDEQQESVSVDVINNNNIHHATHDQSPTTGPDDHQPELSSPLLESFAMVSSSEAQAGDDDEFLSAIEDSECGADGIHTPFFSPTEPLLPIAEDTNTTISIDPAPGSAKPSVDSPLSEAQQQEDNQQQPQQQQQQQQQQPHEEPSPAPVGDDNKPTETTPADPVPVEVTENVIPATPQRQKKHDSSETALSTPSSSKKSGKKKNRRR